MIRRVTVLTCLTLGLCAAEPVVTPGATAPAPTQTSSAATPAAPPAAPANGREGGQRGPQGGRVWLGVMVEEGASFDGKPQPKVTRIVPGSTAEKLGLQPGDQLLQLGDAVLTNVDSFRTASGALKVGDALIVKVVRGTQNLDLKATVEAPPRPRDVLTDADKLRTDAADLRLANERAATTSRLEELLTLLNTVQKGLPESAAEFKKVYPKGTFNVQIHIDICSDPASPQQTPLPPAVPNSTAKPSAPVSKTEAGKTEPVQAEPVKAEPVKATPVEVKPTAPVLTAPK